MPVAYLLYAEAELDMLLGDVVSSVLKCHAKFVLNMYCMASAHSAAAPDGLAWTARWLLPGFNSFVTSNSEDKKVS